MELPSCRRTNYKYLGPIPHSLSLCIVKRVELSSIRWVDIFMGYIRRNVSSNLIFLHLFQVTQEELDQSLEQFKVQFGDKPSE